MDKTENEFKNLLIKEITDSNMSFDRKTKVLKMLDTAFRQYLGVIFLSNQELEDADLLHRSM